MDFNTTSKLIKALPILTDHIYSGKFQRWQSVEVSRANEAAEKMEEILNFHYQICSTRSPRPRPRARLPCLETHLESRKQLVTQGTGDEAKNAHFWLWGAILLREAQDHIREADQADVEEYTDISKEEILQTFQHYILVFLAQGELHSKPLQLFTDEFVDTCVPNLELVRLGWEEGRAFRDILLSDDVWFCWAPEYIGTTGYQMRWKLGIQFQMSLLVE